MERKDQDLCIYGAREHNLKNIDLVIPRNKLVVMTGVSGSGKSSLAFDTIYAEGQRRYVESLSSYARMFIGQMDKPDVDRIDGLSPAISIDQKSTGHNPRSTVGTVTEIYDYLRLLYARCGIPHCPNCGRVIERQSIDTIVDQITALPKGTRMQIIAPCVRGRKGEHQKVLERLQREGYVRVRIDGEVYPIEEAPALDKQKKHTIEAVIDRIVLKDGVESRLTESLEHAFKLGQNLAIVAVQDGEEMLFSQNYACPDCGIALEELAPRAFSFNNPFGACPTCLGLGEQLKIDPTLVVPDESLSLNDGAIKAPGWKSGNNNVFSDMYYEAIARHFGFTMDTPFCDMPKAGRDALLYGTKEKMEVQYERSYGGGHFLSTFEGIVPNMERRYRESQSDWAKTDIESYMAHIPCPDCKGKRLKPTSLAVTVGGKNISELCEMNVKQSREFLRSLVLTPMQQTIAAAILKELDARLGFLVNVGLNYLTLSRAAATLSGGESQRIRLATQIGSGLVGVLYILDEPSIGLHQRDNAKLLETLKGLRDLGNTLIVVEHDEETMRNADFIVDIGPRAGVHGGEVIVAGTPDEVMACETSLTGQYLSQKRTIPVPEQRRAGSGQKLVVRGARANNLKNITVEFPLGKFICVTGVSGSGKSSLVNEILKKRLLHDLNRAKVRPKDHDGIDGIEYLNKIIDIDQSPIGRTPRSNPATYTGLFDLIRALYATTPDAKLRGYTSGRFSFNVKGGRCEACKGDGIV
ncbi:MAG: excinuclease ABC subunit UvrA, partial [Clostridia bacterium]|nr:excinuclease ABC subunit UvrA [Clostridia bacterium]